MELDQRYQILQRIDEQKRYFGLTLDEFIPVSLVILIGWCLSDLLIGFVFSGLVWVIIRHFKKGQGAFWLMNLCYWHFPTEPLKGTFFVKTPDASKRHWLY